MTDILIPSRKKNIVLDATVLSTLMGCARYTELRFGMNLVPIGGKGNSLEVGSLVHKYLEVYYKMIINGYDRDKAHQFAMAAADMYIAGCIHCKSFKPTHSVIQGDEYRADVAHVCNNECILKPKCGHQVDEYPGLENTPPEPEKGSTKVGWKWALSTCEQYYEYYKGDPLVPIEVEMVRGEILYEDDEIRILWKAKLDLVGDNNQGIFPYDHKTAKQKRDKIRTNNQFIGQCLVKKTKQMIVNEIGFQTSLKPQDKFRRVVMSYTNDILLEWQSEILPYWGYRYLEYSESGYWAPNFSGCETKYGKCEFLDVCENNRNMREEVLKMNFKIGTPWNPSND